MINDDSIAKMKAGVTLLNFARDMLVDDAAIANALDSGKIRRYVTDFPNTNLAGKPGVIAVPHLGASTAESEDNCARMACKEIMRYLSNGNVMNSVNFPNVDLGLPTNKGRVTIIHRNVATMITKFSNVFSTKGINIENMISKAKDDYAYLILDTANEVTRELVDELEAIEGVVRVRVIKT